jgi:Fur family ferric uptake transcriptional regulator
LTAQRQLVLEAVYALGHATPDKVHCEVAKTAAGVNITTVYRTLELLEELGLITHAHLSHGAPTYHGVSENQHVHLVCRECGAVAEAPSHLLAPLSGKLAHAWPHITVTRCVSNACSRPVSASSTAATGGCSRCRAPTG